MGAKRGSHYLRYEVQDRVLIRGDERENIYVYPYYEESTEPRYVYMIMLYVEYVNMICSSPGLA